MDRPSPVPVAVKNVSQSGVCTAQGGVEAEPLDRLARRTEVHRHARARAARTAAARARGAGAARAAAASTAGARRAAATRRAAAARAGRAAVVPPLPPSPPLLPPVPAVPVPAVPVVEPPVPVAECRRCPAPEPPVPVAELPPVPGVELPPVPWGLDSAAPRGAARTGRPTTRTRQSLRSPGSRSPTRRVRSPKLRCRISCYPLRPPVDPGWTSRLRPIVNSCTPARRRFSSAMPSDAVGDHRRGTPISHFRRLAFFRHRGAPRRSRMRRTGISFGALSVPHLPTAADFSAILEGCRQ